MRDFEMRPIGLSTFRAMALVSVAAAAFGSPAWAQDAKRQFDIPSQNLAPALEAFGRQSGNDIVFDATLVHGKISGVAVGSYVPDVALKRVLDGSGLTFRRAGAATFIVEPAAPRGASPSPKEAASLVGEIVVTGSNIRGAPPTAPLHTVTRQDIEQSGYSNVGDIIRSLPENFSGGSNPGNIGAGNANQNLSNGSTVNLRGLGDGATLVLINGRRMAADGFGQSADISGIPLMAIARVEIVTDGSSAIYGSDAVSGVANFILRTDYAGVDVNAKIGEATRGGGFSQTYSALVGTSTTSWYGMFNVEYTKQNAILASDRSFTSQAPPNVTLIRPQEQTSAFISAGRRLGDRLSIDFDALWSDRKAEAFAQTRRAGSAAKQSTHTPTYNINSALTFDLTPDWNLRLSAATSHSQINYVSITSSRSHTRYQNRVMTAEAIVEGPILSLPAGDLKAAVGGGRREEAFRRDSKTSSAVVSGSHEIGYIFGEAFVPLISSANGTGGIHRLDLSISGRYENYSDYGSTSTPKFGLSYTPFKGLTLRSTWGKSFKAPTFNQYASAKTVSIVPASNLGGTSGGTALLAVGGNPDLLPEKSKSISIGAEYTPLSFPTAQISVNYFKIDYTDRVVSPIAPASTALTNPNFAPFVTRNPTVSEQAALLSDASTVLNITGTAYNPNNVVAIAMNRPVNATSQIAEGFDLSYRQTVTTNFGEVRLFSNSTWITLKQKTIPTFPNTKISGNIFNIPHFRDRTGISFDRKNFTISGIFNHQSGSVDNGITPNHHISSWNTADGNITYKLIPKSRLVNAVTLGLSVTNIFDVKPPYAASPSLLLHDGIFFDSTNSSPIGRFISLSIGAKY